MIPALAVVGAGALVVGTGASPAAAGGVPVDYTGPTWSAGAATAPTADKQQSKLWRADGAWWGVLISKGKNAPTIHELRSNNTWRDTGTVVDDRADSTADLWYVTGTLFAVSRTMNGDIRYYRFSYDTATRTYTKQAGYPVKIAGGGTESASMARDSIGRVWATWTQGGKVWVSRTFSKTDHTRWLTPMPVPVPDTTVSGDDVSAIVAWDSRIGIMWSDQDSDVFRFAWHADSSPAASGWTMETPIPSTDALADDHISLKASGTRVFAAVKTSFDTIGATPESASIYVLRRDAGGTWAKTKAASIGDKSTRPQLLLDRDNARVYYFATASTSGGTIYYKSSPFVGLRFARGRGAPIIANAGSVINNVTTSKASVPQSVGAVVLAAAENSPQYFHSKLSLTPTDGQPPIAQTTINSVVNANESVTTTWPLATDDRFVVAYDVYRNGTKIHTIDATTATTADLRVLSFTDTPGDGTWTYSYIARDAAGNVSDEEVAVAVTVPVPPATP